MEATSGSYKAGRSRNAGSMDAMGASSRHSATYSATNVRSPAKPRKLHARTVEPNSHERRRATATCYTTSANNVETPRMLLRVPAAVYSSILGVHRAMRNMIWTALGWKTARGFTTGVPLDSRFTDTKGSHDIRSQYIWGGSASPHGSEGQEWREHIPLSQGPVILSLVTWALRELQS